MTWFKDRWLLLRDAYSRRKWPITFLFFVATILGTIDYLKEFVSRWIIFPSGGSIEILGIRAPQIGVVIFLIGALWWMLEVALEFRKLLIPAIDVSFNPDAEGRVKTRTEIQDGRSVKIRDDMATYIRLTLTSRSRKTVKGCVVFLTRLEKRLNPADQFVDIPLQGAVPLTPQPIDVYPRVPT